MPRQSFIGQGHYSKVKGQIKVTPWHCTPTTLTNVPAKYQLPTPYGFQDIARGRFYRSRSLQQHLMSNQDHTMTLHTHNPLINVPTNYQLPILYSFRDIARNWFYRSTSLVQGQRLNQGHTMTVHTYTPNQCPSQVSTSYTLWFLRYSPDKLFTHGWRGTVQVNILPKDVIPHETVGITKDRAHRPEHPPIRTPWVKIIPRQPLWAVG